MGKIHTFPGLPPAAATHIAAKMLNKHSPGEIGQAIDILIDLLNLLGGDPEEEDTDLEDDFQLSPRALSIGGRAPGDITAEPDDTAYVEWHSMHGNQKKRGQNLLAGHEDDEEDDASEEGGDEHDTGNAEDEDLTGSAAESSVAGCSVSEPDVEHDGREEQQMPGDVPMPSVVSFEHNLFNDERQELGILNLSSSFVGRGVLSADMGRMHSNNGRDDAKPGKPV